MRSSMKSGKNREQNSMSTERIFAYVKISLHPIVQSMVYKVLRLLGLIVIYGFILLYGTERVHASWLELITPPSTSWFISSEYPISEWAVLENSIKANDININFCNRDDAGNYWPYLQRQLSRWESFPLCTLISNNSDSPAYLTLHYISGKSESGDVSCLDEYGSIESLVEEKRYVLIPAHGFGKVTREMVIQEDTIGCVNFWIINATVDNKMAIKPMVRKFYVYKFKTVEWKKNTLRLK